MVDLSRRRFLTLAGAALVAGPAIVRASSLMPVKVMGKIRTFDADAVIAHLVKEWDEKRLMLNEILYGDNHFRMVSAMLLPRRHIGPFSMEFDGLRNMSAVGA